MAKRPNRSGEANAAGAAAEALRPEIERLHRDAKRAAANRRKLIESITDPSLRSTVR